MGLAASKLSDITDGKTFLPPVSPQQCVLHHVLLLLKISQAVLLNLIPLRKRSKMQGPIQRVLMVSVNAIDLNELLVVIKWQDTCLLIHTPDFAEEEWAIIWWWDRKNKNYLSITNFDTRNVICGECKKSGKDCDMCRQFGCVMLNSRTQPVLSLLGNNQATEHALYIDVQRTDDILYVPIPKSVVFLPTNARLRSVFSGYCALDELNNTKYAKLFKVWGLVVRRQDSPHV